MYPQQLYNFMILILLLLKRKLTNGTKNKTYRNTTTWRLIRDKQLEWNWMDTLFCEVLHGLVLAFGSQVIAAATIVAGYFDRGTGGRESHHRCRRYVSLCGNRYARRWRRRAPGSRVPWVLIHHLAVRLVRGRISRPRISGVRKIRINTYGSNKTCPFIFWSQSNSTFLWQIYFIFLLNLSHSLCQFYFIFKRFKWFQMDWTN